MDKSVTSVSKKFQLLPWESMPNNRFLIAAVVGFADMASLGVFTFNFDPLLAKMGLVAVGCLLLVGLFHAGYSGVGTPFGHSVRRRVIKAQRQGDFRDRLRKRLGERESGFRVTYQQALPNSYFTGTRQAAVPEELFDGVHGARNIMTRSESDKLRKAKAGAEGSHRSSPVARHTTSHREHSVHPDYHNASPLTTLDDQMITQPGAAQFQVDRPSRNVSAATKERRSIAPSPASPTNVRAVSSAVGENKPTKVPLEEIEYMRASARSGIVGKWQEKDEVGATCTLCCWPGWQFLHVYYRRPVYLSWRALAAAGLNTSFF